MPRFTPWLVVVTLTAAGAAAAAGYGLTAPKRYSATAQLLVVPVSASDPTWAGLDVLRNSSGRRTAASTAAELLRSPQVADAVRAQLGLRQSSHALLGELHAHVAGSSDVVDVTIEDGSPAAAAQLANAFVDALIAQRTATFQSELSSAVKRDTQLLAGEKNGPQATELARRLALLRSFQGQPDPTVRRGDVAVAPASPSWPSPARIIAAGTGAGLAAGALVALALLAWGHRRTSGLALYDRGVDERSERAVHVLVDRLEQRLAGREKALAARERDLQARIDELKALDVQPPDARGAELAERERALEDRIAVVTRRELEVARHAAAVGAHAERERELAEREEELERRAAALREREQAAHPQADELAAREAELAERERALAERVAVVTEREVELARRFAAARAAAATQEMPAGAAPVPPPAAATGDGRGTYNLIALEQLVEERAAAYPERADEWRSYLFFLRDYAGADGSLPGSFDWLILDTFREIVA